MKKRLIIALGLLTAAIVSVNAAERFRDDSNSGILYEWADDTHTAVITASANFKVEFVKETKIDYNQWPWVEYEVEVPRLVGDVDPDGGTTWDGYLLGPNSSISEIVIPATINHNGVPYPVIGIGDYSFANDSQYGGGINKIVLPGTDMFIGNGAFFHGGSINNPGSFEITGANQIGDYAFYKFTFNANGNFDITIPSSVERVGNYAFADCSFGGLKDLYVNASVIGENAFAGLTVDNIHIGENVTEIGNSAFKGCQNIKSIDFAENSKLSKIGDSAFEGTKGSLDRLEIPASVTDLGASAFKDFDNIKDLEVNASVIGENAFSGAFVNNIHIGENVSEIGDSAFKGCKNVGSIDFADGSKLNKIGASAFEISVTIESLTIPDSVSEIGESAFKGLNIKDLTINCVSLPANAFAGNDIGSLHIGSNVREIGDSAFKGCKNMNKIEFVEVSQLETIGESAFEDVRGNFDKIKIPSSVTKMGKAAFKGLSSVITLIIDMTGEIPEEAFMNINQANTTIIGDHVTKIGKSAFENSTNIKTLKIGENVKTICDNAFRHCTGLEFDIDGNSRLVIPDSVEFIGDGAFEGITNIHDFLFGCNLQHVGENAFQNNDFRVHNMYLPKSLTEIGKNGFNNLINNVTNFTDLYYPNPTPTPEDVDPYPVDDNAFGPIFGVDDATYTECWIYETVCLHVPQGTAETYRLLPGWRNFKCIIDDLYNDTKTSLGNVVGYVFMVPGEELDIEADVLPTVDSLKDCVWDVIDDTEVATVDAEGHVVAYNFGQRIAVARTDMGKRVYDENGNVIDSELSITGLVVIYVCPRVILAYSIEEKEVGDNSGEGPNVEDDDVLLRPRAAKIANMDDIDNPEVVEMATYEHRVVYNSFPQVKVEAARGYTLIDLAHGDAEDDRTWSDDKLDTPTTEEQEDYLGNDNVYALTVTDPVINNRVIVVLVSADLDDEEYQHQTTGVKSVQVSDNVKLLMNGRKLTLEGASDNDVVTVANVNGHIVHNSTEKTFTLPERGVYVIKVGDTTFKVVVK